MLYNNYVFKVVLLFFGMGRESELMYATRIVTARDQEILTCPIEGGDMVGDSGLVDALWGVGIQVHSYQTLSSGNVRDGHEFDGFYFRTSDDPPLRVEMRNYLDDVLGDVESTESSVGIDLVFNYRGDNIDSSFGLRLAESVTNVVDTFYRAKKVLSRSGVATTPECEGAHAAGVAAVVDKGE